MKAVAPIRYIIVDDNPLDQMMVRTLASRQPALQHLSTFSNPIEAISQISLLKPDLLFLDVEMPGATGIELLKTVRQNVPMAIFITSYADFALESYELSALDYILKPLTDTRFNQSIQRVYEYWEMKQKSTDYDVLIEKDALYIKQGHDKIRLSIQEIIYLEAMHDYTKIHTSGKSYITLGALSHFLEQVPPHIFVRIHRSYAVAIRKISGVKKNEIRCQDIALPVGRTYKEYVDDLAL